MTTEEVIQTLEHGSWWDLLDPDGSDADLTPLHEALDVALSALREKQNGGWISVKDRLPPARLRVLVWFSGNRNFDPQSIISFRIPNSEEVMYENEFGKATHWQPLPMPPKGD